MRTRFERLALLAPVVAFLIAVAIDTAGAQSVALTGTVSSAAEGAMEGVLVSARKDGSTITVTVATDEMGRYSFPAARLAPGPHAIGIRAAGYDLEGPKRVDIAAGTATTADIKLRPTRNLSAQLNNAEWLASAPGTAQQKRFLLNCVTCHTLERIVKSTYDAGAFLEIFNRMAGYYPGSTPLAPQRLPSTARRDISRGANLEGSAKFLASINLSEAPTWSYPLKTLPRPKGRATRAIVTEYDLPRQVIQPHDVVLDPDGMVWYSSFGEQALGRMDPKTGAVKEFPVPLAKKEAPTGALDLEIDTAGNLWLGMMFQVALVRFDRKSETFRVYAVPPEMQNDLAQTAMATPSPDGKTIWGKISSTGLILRLDPESGKYDSFQTKDLRGRTLRGYGTPTDQDNNLWLLEFVGSEIGKVDGKTGALTIYPTPTAGSRPRRGRFDEHNRLWFGEFGGNAIGMFDPKTETFKEWKLPTEWSAPYDVVMAKNGDAWTGSMFTDRVARLDAKTNQFVEYLLPRSTNIRRVFVDDRTNALWVGNNNGASIIKVEPLD